MEGGRSLWEAVLEHLRSRDSATRIEILQRFCADDESQVKAVLHDLCESQLVLSSGSGASTTYRAVSGDELVALQKGRGAAGLDELLLAVIYREAPLPADEIARRAKLTDEEAEPILARLVQEGRIEHSLRDGVAHYQAKTLLVPVGASAGWEAAMFDHFKALVTTIICRVRDDSATPRLTDRVGGSTYTVTVWPGHPLAEEVCGTLGRLRTELTDLRERVKKVNDQGAIPDAHTRVVVYFGQSLIDEGNGPDNDRQ
jgi:hypothetical protein